MLIICKELSSAGVLDSEFQVQLETGECVFHAHVTVAINALK